MKETVMKCVWLRKVIPLSLGPTCVLAAGP